VRWRKVGSGVVVFGEVWNQNILISGEVRSGAVRFGEVMCDMAV